MCCTSGCLTGILLVVGWWLVASTLLYFSWNKVVTNVTNLKPGKFWYALLIVATLFAFCGPRYMMKKGCGWKKGCGTSASKCAKCAKPGCCKKKAGESKAPATQ